MERTYQRVVAPVPSRRVARVPSTPVSCQPSGSKVIALYHDGASLTFLFDRFTRIVDLMPMISRAGRVRKVIL